MRRTVKLLARAAVFASLVAGSTSVARADDPPPLGLDALEARIDQAPGIRADARQIDVDIQAEGVSYARSGLDYVFGNAIGPRSDIVTKNLNSNAFRYSQSLGVQLPILGSAISQNNALEEARTTEALARIEYEDERRTALAKLRSAYVLYWQYDREQAVAQSYVERFEHDMHVVRALRKSGFWTEANLLDYLDTLSRFRTDVRTARSLRREQLAIISSAVGEHIALFRPLEPKFAADCRPPESDALASALAIDPELAKIAADAVDVTFQLLHVRGSSIDARLEANIGTVADIVPSRLGYELTAGIAVSLPSHARSEERSLRDQLADELDEQTLRAEQRRADVESGVEAELDELDDARVELAQARVDEQATFENLREAEIRYRTIAALGAESFNDVETRLAETFTSENATVIARSTVFLKLEALLETAPDACS
jgi:outer membrane protein TolC